MQSSHVVYIPLQGEGLETRYKSNQVHQSTIEQVCPTFANKLARLTLVPQIKARDNVVLVEEDRVIVATRFTEQFPVPSWGLSRICHQTRPRYLSTYTYDNSGGNRVTVYVIDTGINLDHVDFEGRASFGYNSVGDGSDEDGVGHGTHVSGTIAGKTFGIAKKAQIVAVKVLDSTAAALIPNLSMVAKHKSVANM
jgi:subtilisin family serine protease